MVLIAHGLAGNFLLSDRGLEKALADGDIKIKPLLDEDQIQPGSLDVRIGKVRVYGKDFSDDDISEENSIFHPDKKDSEIKIPPRSYADVFLHEKISIKQEKYNMDADLRSSRGRLGLSLESRKMHRADGSQFLRVFNNNPNTIMLHGQSKFAQAFFYPEDAAESNGYVVTDVKEAKGLAEVIFNEPVKMFDHYAIFNLGEHILKFRKGLGVIDTKKTYTVDSLYETHDTKRPFVLKPGDAVVAQLAPSVNLPDDIGVYLLHNIPYNTKPIFSPIAYRESKTSNAGWVDPGYKMNITAHPVQTKNPCTLKQGDPLALAVIIKYTKPVKRPYGTPGLKSRYQNSDGVGYRN